MSTSELELKFGIPSNQLQSLRKGLLNHGAQSVQLQSFYFDTRDGLLAAQGRVLRVRQDAHGWVQTLKAPGDGAVHHFEHEARLEHPVGGVPLPDTSLHSGTATGAALHAQLQALPPSQALVQRHGTSIARLQCMVDVGNTRIEVALDEGVARGGSRQTQINELELEHKAGPVAGLFELALLWQRHGGLWLSVLSKSERASRLLHADGDAPPARHARALQMPARANGPDFLRAVLQSVLQQVLANASDIAEGRCDVALVHQLRVGLRRLRTALVEFAPLLRDQPDARNAALRRLVTAANVHDKHPLPDLLHGQETEVYGDCAHPAQHELMNTKAPAARDCANKLVRKDSPTEQLERLINRAKSRCGSGRAMSSASSRSSGVQQGPLTRLGQ